eukprot:1682832-Rhodomonas_salina.2
MQIDILDTIGTKRHPQLLYLWSAAAARRSDVSDPGSLRPSWRRRLPSHWPASMTCALLVPLRERKTEVFQPAVAEQDCSLLDDAHADSAPL